MKVRSIILGVLIAAIFAVAAFGPVSANSGRAWGNLVEGEQGVWRVHFAVLGIENGTGQLFGQVVSNAAQMGIMGGHASGR